MFRLTFLLLIGIGAAMMVGGRDLTPEEMAALGIEPRVEVSRAGTESLTAATADLPAPAPAPAAADDVVLGAAAAAGADTLVEPASAPEPAAPGEVAAVEPEPQPGTEAEVPTVADEIAAALSDAQVWYVNAELVNVREGPSTDFARVGKVAYGDAIEILSDPDDAWVRIRIQGDGVEGYVARRFLQDSEPNG
jgi:hypothetical protein